MAIVKQTVSYSADGAEFEALAVWDDEGLGPRPGVAVVPTFMGRTEMEDGHAERLATLGYVGFSVDLYGNGVRPGDFDQAKAAMDALTADRASLARRMTAAIEQVGAFAVVDPAKRAALGFCLGGKCVLDLARTGIDICGVASFHGVYDAPEAATAERIAAKILVLHGWDDPICPPDAVLALAKELDAKGADWELDAYSATGHGFTNPHRPEMYRERANLRAWERCEDFLLEIFA
jgi:dienelactone hydrolase